MARPRALDLYCCAGGAAKGLHDAGFDVVGVDTGKGTMEEWQTAMEIDWMTRREIVEAVPPAYAEAIGRCAIQQLNKYREAAE